MQIEASVTDRTKNQLTYVSHAGATHMLTLELFLQPESTAELQ